MRRQPDLLAHLRVALLLRGLALQLLECGTLLLPLRAKDPQALVPGLAFLIEPDAVDERL